MTRALRLHLLLLLTLGGAVPAISQTQGGVDVLLANARSLEARGRIDMAAQNWRKVLLADPNQTEALAGLARYAKEKDQIDEERSWLDRLRKVDPHNSEIAEVENLRVFSPEERNRLDEAGRLSMQRKHDEAMRIYREVLGDQLPPLSKWAQPFYEAEAASTGGRDKAIAQLRQLCAQNPKQEAYRLWLATLLTYDPKTRIEGFHLFESIKDPGFAQQARGPWRQSLLWENQNLDALAPIETYLERYPDQELQASVGALRAKQQQNIVDANRELAFKALRSAHIEDAGAGFTEVLRQSPNDLDAVVGLGYVRLDQKRFGEALGLFDRARALAPQRQDAREGYDSARFSMAMERGAAAQQRNESQLAVQAYQEALTLRPSDKGARLGLANAFLEERNFTGAEARFQQVLNQAPANTDALAGMGSVRLHQERFDDAAELFAQAHKLDPTRTDLEGGYQDAKFWGTMSQAVAALNQGRPKDAVAGYQQALLLNPNDKDALRGLANAFVHAADYSGAVKSYSQLTATCPTDEAGWLGLIQAQMDENALQDAISTSQRIPPAVKQQMEGHSDFFSEMALVYYKANQPAPSDQALRRALELPRTSDSDDALSMRLQLAGAFMDQGKTERAIEIYRQATQLHPEKPSGWEGLVGAYTRQGAFSPAATVVSSMPQSSYDAALKHVGFLNSVALLYSSEGECTQAKHILQRSLSLDQTAGRPLSESTQLQLADVLMHQHNYPDAVKLYHDIVTRNADSPEAWRGYLVVLHQPKSDRALVVEIPNIPPAVRIQLEKNASFLALEASAYSSVQRNQDALPLLRQARSRFMAQHELPPVNLDIQTAWTALAVSPDEAGLGDLLLTAKRRTGLSAKQRDGIEELWSTWSVRRAGHAALTSPQLAISILQDAAREYRGDRDIHVALASLYLKQNDKQKALDVFQDWGLRGAQAGDYRMAAGTALSAHDNDLAHHFLRLGLINFPNDPELMHMTARQDIARGNYETGERELQSALLALREERTSGLQASTLSSPPIQQGANPILEAHDDFTEESSTWRSTPTCRPEPANRVASEGRIRPISLVLTVSRTQDQEGQNASEASAGKDQAQKQQEKQQIEEEVEAVENRNTPIVSTGGVGAARLGDPGIDRLIISDNFLGGVYTVSNQVRFGVEAHGVYAYSGTPDGSSSLRFGTLPEKMVFGEQSQIGYSGLAQLSTNTFGLAVGTTPQGFVVHNLIGGIRFRPRNGSVTFLGTRDSVKDSLLSYAGAHDPGTGIPWGGVVSNTVNLKLDSGPISGDVYKRFGVYASGSYSLLHGLNVPNNWSGSGNAGFYWQMVQGLTMGVNASAMHYDRNLKYFSFGQGGYFSPQQYYLASIPISWYSRHPRFECEVKFSGGVQYLREAASPLYPVLPRSAKVIQGTYPPDSSTSPNYDANIHLGYHLTPHMYLDIYATANNAQNYNTVSAGFSLKFMLDSIPTSTGLRVDSIPDWTGKQPFSVR